MRRTLLLLVTLGVLVFLVACASRAPSSADRRATSQKAAGETAAAAPDESYYAEVAGLEEAEEAEAEHESEPEPEATREDFDFEDDELDADYLKPSAETVEGPRRPAPPRPGAAPKPSSPRKPAAAPTPKRPAPKKAKKKAAKRGEAERRREVERKVAQKTMLKQIGAARGPSDGKGGAIEDLFREDGGDELTDALKAAAQEISRYPAMESPEQVKVGEAFPLMVWLSVDPVAQKVEVKVGPKAKQDEEGRVQLALPPPDPSGSWTLDVVLMAPGFEVRGSGYRQQITLPAEGDSTPALFDLVARPVTAEHEARTLAATLWHGGTYLARLGRDVTVLAPGARLPASAAVRTRVAGAMTTVDAAARVADLTMRVEYDDPGALGRGRVVLTSPHFQNPIQLGDVNTPPDLVKYLRTYYQRFMEAERGRSGFDGGDATVPLMRGFGRELYKKYAPKAFKQAFCTLAGDGSTDLQTIQIYSNNPLLPWELMRPSCPGGKDHDFLAVELAIARWHVGDQTKQLDRPLQRLGFGRLTAIAPAYADGVLPYQEDELDALARVPGYKRVPGTRAALRQLMGGKPEGVIHFAGHGEIHTVEGGVPEYAIRLEDGTVDLMSWRGLAESGSSDGHPFYFFNACDLGQAHQVANFVEGWAPAVLDAGASGYVGGLWPLDDESASQFSARFYKLLARRLADGPVRVAEVVRDNRRRFFTTGDPTWLAYVYYGDVNLRFVAN